MQLDYTSNKDATTTRYSRDNWGDKIDPLTQHGNIQYGDFIRVIKDLFGLAHPGVGFHPEFDNTISFEVDDQPDKGFLFYSLVEKVPRSTDPKPRFHHRFNVNEGEENETTIFIYRQTFECLVKFSGASTDPFKSEKIIEIFEDFMTEVTHIFKQLGLEDIFYFKRSPDNFENRSGKGLHLRPVLYRVNFQKLYRVDQTSLQKYILHLSTEGGLEPGTLTLEPNENYNTGN